MTTNRLCWLLSAFVLLAAIYSDTAKADIALHGQRFSDHVNAQGHAASELATEKVGAAAVIATERNATVLQVQAERIRADAALQAERVRAELSAQNERYQIANTLALSDFRREATKDHCETLAKLAECCCDLKATIKEVESNRIRDDLAQCRAELLASRRGH